MPLEIRRRGRIWSARAITGYGIIGMGVLMPLILGAVDGFDPSFTLIFMAMLVTIGAGFFGMFDGKATVFLATPRSIRVLQHAGKRFVEVDRRRFDAAAIPRVQVARRETRDPNSSTTYVQFYVVIPLGRHGLELQCADEGECRRVAKVLADALGVDAEGEPYSQGSWSAENWLVALVGVPVMIGGAIAPFIGMIYHWSFGANVATAVVAAVMVYGVTRVISARAAQSNIAKRMLS